MYLVIAEKPSVSKAIAEVIGASKKEEGYLEGKGCIVSWCFGHLAEYVPPDSYDERFTRWLYEDLPIIPEEWKLAVSKDKKEQFYILKKLLNRPDIEFVVNACDAGREGELIFKHVYDLSRSKKPVKRLWISSLESSSILEGIEHLKAGETYHNLAEAAVCRAQADWLVGMNATRAYLWFYDLYSPVLPKAPISLASPRSRTKSAIRTGVITSCPTRVSLRSIWDSELTLLMMA